jgi:hypothetical protein
MLATTTTLFLLGALTLFTATAAPAEDVNVVFDADDMGFTATSDKDISNVIVELCDQTLHKHDGLTGHTYTHDEAQGIVGVWVKSGNNGIPGNNPPGAGERFDNAGVDCTPELPCIITQTCIIPCEVTQTCVTSSTSTTSSSSTSTSPPPTCPQGDARMTTYVFHVNDGPPLLNLDTVQSGDTVKADFTIAAGCDDIEVSLVSYKAPSATFSEATADEQVLFDSDTGFFDAGAHSLEVDVPDCYFQVDFVFGPVLVTLGPEGSGNFYGSRLIDAENGGTQSCTTTTTSSSTSSTSSSSTSSTSSSTSETTTSTSETTTSTSETSSTTSDTETSTQIPFFPSTAAIALGLGGILAAGFVMLRRRL